MSVYSGFSTRHMETSYYQLVESLLSLFQGKVLAELQGKEVSVEDWVTDFLEVFAQMSRLEASKYLPPKLSLCVGRLAQHCATLRKSALPPLAPSSPINNLRQSPRTPTYQRPQLPEDLVANGGHIEEKSNTKQSVKLIRLVKAGPRRLSPEARGRREFELGELHSHRYYSRLMLQRLRGETSPLHRKTST